MLKIGFVLTLTLLALSSRGDAEEDSQSSSLVNTSSVQLEVFTGPRPKELRPPQYPRKEQLQGKEGWVQVNFMISPEGKPYEVAVTHSSGSESFERAAVRAVSKWSFEPATMDGQPIDAGSNHKITFALTGSGTGARSSFVRSHRKLQKSISERDQESAKEELAALEPQNLYEDAYFHLARFHYYKEWGTKLQQLNALRLGVAHESQANYLPNKLFLAALLSMFVLEVELQDYAGALKTWEKLKAQDLGEQRLASLRNAVNDILVLQKDDRTYSVSGQIGASSSWYHRLLKNRFRIDVRNGEVAEIKLRCDKKYVFFRYDPDIQYHVSDQYGECGIEVVGNPGTEFSLIQS